MSAFPIPCLKPSPDPAQEAAIIPRVNERPVSTVKRGVANVAFVGACVRIALLPDNGSGASGAVGSTKLDDQTPCPT